MYAFWFRRLALLMVLLLPATAGAQVRVVEVSGPPVCSGCSLELTRVTTLGRESDDHLMDKYGAVSRDRRGRYYVARMATPGVFGVYDSTGVLLRTVGRQGQGPGEFESDVSSIHVGAGDTVYTFDTPLQRTSVFGPDLALVRTTRYLRGTVGYVILPSGSMITQSLSYEPDRMGQPLHLMKPDGTIVRSFGAGEQPHVSRETDVNGFRAVSPVRGRPDRLWAAYRNTYRIEQWDTAGRHLLTVTRKADWFDSWLEPQRRQRTPEPPKPYLWQVWEDEEGHLWVWTRVADPRWKPWTPGEPAPTWEQEYDAVLEIIDPANGRLVASIRMPGPMHQMLADDLTVTERQEESGYVFKDVWRLTLRTP